MECRFSGLDLKKRKLENSALFGIKELRVYTSKIVERNVQTAIA